MPESEAKLPKVLSVFLNDTDVGTLHLLADGRTLFTFSESYIKDPSRPTLSLSFKTPLGELRTEEPARRNGILPPFFSNLLPEGHLREYLAKKANVKPQREFLLLAALGKDLPGAVRVKPIDVPDFNQNIEAGESTRSTPLRLMRFSLAGVQLKFSAIMEAKGGLTIPADGAGGAWIVKLPSNVYAHVPEAEYSMLRLAQSVGIEVPECKLIPTGSISGLPDDIPESFGDSLAVKRFDRLTDGGAIHMEDFAQVFGLYPHEKYEKASFDRIGYVLLTETGEADFLEFIRRLVFTVLIGNGDMHLKNWSLVYPNTRAPWLSPAYDFVPTVLYLNNDDMGLPLGGEKRFGRLAAEHFAKLASKAAASERMVLHTVRETTARIADAWKTVRSELPLPTQMSKKLNSHINRTVQSLK